MGMTEAALAAAPGSVGSAAGWAGTWLLCFAVAAAIWFPFEQRWPRVALGFFAAGLVALLGSGFIGLVRRLVLFVADRIVWGLGLIHINGQRAVVLSIGAILAASTVVALAYVAAHVAPSKWVSAGVAESTFIAVTLLVIMASIIPGPAGKTLNAIFGGLSDALTAPLTALFT